MELSEEEIDIKKSKHKIGKKRKNLFLKKILKKKKYQLKKKQKKNMKKNL